MKRFLSTLMILGCAAVIQPSIVLASTKPTATEQTTTQKKKKPAATAQKKAKPAATAQKKEAKPVRKTAKRDCGSFLQCLFGKPVNRTTSASARASGVDRPTVQEVDWKQASKYSPGSIVVSTPERALYLVTGDGEALRYKVGVGKEGFQWSGTSRIVAKKEWPDWTPPKEMIKREAAKGHIIPDFMEGGPGNPLGARALYIGGTIFRIHGTNNAASIGGAVSSGCIRMMNSDVIDLYERVKVGAKVYVYQ